MKLKKLVKKCNKIEKKSKKYTKFDKKFYNKYGFDKSDSWSLDFYTILFLLPRIHYLRKIAHGFPVCLIDMKKLDYKEENKKGAKKWNKILKKIEKGFYLYVSKDSVYWTEKDTKLWNEAFDLFTKYFTTLWD